MYISQLFESLFIPLLSLLLLLPIGYTNTFSKNAAPASAVLSFAGDCTLGSVKSHFYYKDGFIVQIQERGFAYPFSGVIDLFSTDDLTIVNLEGTFTDSKKAKDKPFAFRAPPAFAEIVKLGSVEAVNIANNHINDFGPAGKADTVAALDLFGIGHFGNGELAIYEVNGIRIGMTGYTYPHWNTLQNLAERDIPVLRALGCDIIVLSIHAGEEEQYKTSETLKRIFRGAVDLGVDIVFGHHPHVLQGVEVYQGKPIFYSLGNFAFGGNLNPKDWDTMIGQVVIQKDENGVRPVEMRLIPCLISAETRHSDFRPVPAEGERARSILMKVKRYSPLIDPLIFETGRLLLEE